MVGSTVALLGKENVVSIQRSYGGWILESNCRLLIGVGRRHPVTMSKRHTKTVCSASVSVVTPDWCAVLKHRQTHKIYFAQNHIKQ